MGKKKKQQEDYWATSYENDIEIVEKQVEDL
jgi:hypothetical protein